MNRRSFLKFCGIAPVVPGLASTPFDEAVDNMCFSTFKPDIIVNPMLADGTWIKKRNCLVVSPDLALEAKEIVSDMINRHYSWS